MVDPRIYRVGLVAVAVAVIIFGFSLQPGPSGLAGTVAPGNGFGSAPAQLTSLARAFPDRAAGSAGDAALASWTQRQLLAAGGFTVSAQSFSARTGDGPRNLTTVTAVRTGVGSGAVVVLAPRDAVGSPAKAALSGTVVLVDLARTLGGQTLSRTLVLVSSSGSVGQVGAAQVARSLAGQQVDAVIVLGDLASARVRGPVVVPWSSDPTVAPDVLRQTVAAFVAQQTGLRPAAPDLASQLAHLAFPFSVTAQAPFGGAGIPAVTVSLSGDRLPEAGAAVDPVRMAGLGAAVLQTVDALQAGALVPPPSMYLTISGHTVPRWAIRLLVLALILPVALATLDALARARRRGHPLRLWALWVLAGAVPFLAGCAVLVLARVAGLLHAPAGAVGAGAIPIGARGWAVMLVAAAAVLAGLWRLRPLCVRYAARLGRGGARPANGPAIDGAAVALSGVMCVLALVLWWVNPVAAALLVPALHLWIWLPEPRLHARRFAVVALVAVALLPVLLLAVHDALALGLSPVGLIWSGVLFVAGGGTSPAADLYWSVVLGGCASAAVIAARVAPARAERAPEVTVRGPATYAGPGSLGGTKSALRR